MSAEPPLTDGRQYDPPGSPLRLRRLIPPDDWKDLQWHKDYEAALARIRETMQIPAEYLGKDKDGSP